MKAFISYSINDTDQYILTLLARELHSDNVQITQSHDFNIETSNLTKINIQKSNLFIGIITGFGTEKQRVLNEWHLANVAAIPTILLIENTVQIPSTFNSPYISFDRNYPEQAVSILNEEIRRIKVNAEKNPSALPWIIGGAALAAIVGLLASNKDNE